MLHKFLIFFITAFVIFGCTGNLLRDLADKNSDDALLFDAKTAVNAQDYDTAIDILTNQLSSSAKLKVEARETLSGAYAGKCGLNFLDFVQGLADATSGSAFVLASSPFVGKAVDSAYCLLSLQTLDLIGPTASRTIDQKRKHSDQ